jgi:hypothetical protein
MQQLWYDPVRRGSCHSSSSSGSGSCLTPLLHVCCCCCRQVLAGPFVDVEQPLVNGGMIDVTFAQLFQTQAREGGARRSLPHAEEAAY